MARGTRLKHYNGMCDTYGQRKVKAVAFGLPLLFNSAAFSLLADHQALTLLSTTCLTVYAMLNSFGSAANEHLEIRKKLSRENIGSKDGDRITRQKQLETYSKSIIPMLFLNAAILNPAMSDLERNDWKWSKTEMSSIIKKTFGHEKALSQTSLPARKPYCHTSGIS